MTTVFGDVQVKRTSGEYGGMSASDPSDMEAVILFGGPDRNGAVPQLQWVGCTNTVIRSY